MTNQIIRDNILSISNIRFVLRGYWSGYDDTTYLVYSDDPCDTSTAECRSTFIADFCAFDFSQWYNCQVPYLVDPRCSPYWALEISFSNGLAPLCFSSKDDYPSNFRSFLDLVYASEEDDPYYDYY